MGDAAGATLTFKGIEWFYRWMVRGDVHAGEAKQAESCGSATVAFNVSRVDNEVLISGDLLPRFTRLSGLSHWQVARKWVMRKTRCYELLDCISNEELFYEILEVFNNYDKYGDGTIDRKELSVLLTDVEGGYWAIEQVDRLLTAA